MQEKPVRKTNWLGIISFILGVWGFLTSFLFVTLFISPGYVFSLGEGVNDLMMRYYSLFGKGPGGMLVSTLLGLAGILLGSLGWRRGGWLARAGVLLGILVILAGFPSILLLIGIYGA